MSGSVADVVLYVVNAVILTVMQIGFTLVLPIRWRYKWLPVLLYFIFFTILFPFSYQGNAYITTAMTAGVIITPIIFYKGKLWERILLPCLSTILSVVIDFIIDSFFSVLGVHMETNEQKVPGAIIIAVIFIFLYFCFIRIWSRFRKRVIHMNMTAFTIFPLAQIISFLTITYFVWIIKHGVLKEFSVIPFWSVIFVTIFMYIVSDILLFRALYQNSQNFLLKEQINLLEKKNAWEIEYNNMILQKEGEISKIRHDFINIIQLLKLEAADQVQSSMSDNVLKELELELDKTRPPKFCSNNFINQIITDRMSKASEEGVIFETNISLGEYENISNLDLSRVFMNVIDNALDAVLHVNNTHENTNLHKRFIRISAAEINGYIVIKSQNTYDGMIYKQSGFLKTRKQGTDIHGLGLSIIQGIAEKYQGELLIDYTESMFNLTLTLKT